MHSKKHNRNQTKRRRSKRGKRNTAGRNGGMHRVFSATGRVVGKVMGKGFDRVDKIKDIADAIRKGVTQSQSHETFKPAAMARQFSASPSSPFRMVSETPRRHKSHNANDEFETPNKGASNSNATPPNLGTRVRRRETPEERRQRLGFSMAPTMENPTSMIGELFP